MKELYALGVGHSTPLFVEIAEACGYHVVGLFHYNDERTNEEDHGCRILGSFEDLLNSDVRNKEFLLTMGDNEIRKNIFKKIKDKGGLFPTIIHPTAVISKHSNISKDGVVIGPFVDIQTDVIIGNNTMIWSGAVVCHNTSIGNHCFVGPKALVGAYTKVSDNVYFGQGALSISGKVSEIGEKVLIGARSLVCKSIPENVVVYGTPATIIRKRFQ